ncbi:MAG: SPOR domain-containing protein [Pseudomonadota bacterium]
MSEKRKSKKDKMTGIVGNRKTADGEDDDFHDRISSFIDELSSDEVNGEAIEESTHDQAESGNSEIERGVAEVFDRFADELRPDGKPRESIEAPLDIEIQFEGEDDASESKQGDIEHGVAEVFDKYDAAPLADGKQQEIIETPVNIEITDGDKDDTAESKHKFPGIIYAAAGIFFVLLALIGVKLFKPAGEFDKNLLAKTVDAYKIDRPSKSILTPKVMPLKTESRKKSETNAFENTDPSGEAPEDSTGDGDSTSSESTAKPAPVSNGQHPHPYTIHVASYRDKDVSNRAVEALRTDGFLAFSSCVEIPGKGIWYRIFVDYYETLEAARNAALNLKHKEMVYANTVDKPFVIQVGIFDSESELKKMESDLRAKGHTPYRVPDEAHKGRTKLCIGAYDSIKDAAVEKKNLQNERFPTTVVRR